MRKVCGVSTRLNEKIPIPVFFTLLFLIPSIVSFHEQIQLFGPFETPMQKFWNQYCAISGGDFKLEMVILELHELYESTITHNGLANGDFDIAHINTDWVYEGYLNNAFELLNPYINTKKPVDFPNGWSKSLLSVQPFGWKVVDLPFHGGPECLIYRTDLFESETEQANYLQQFGKVLEVPKT